MKTVRGLKIASLVTASLAAYYFLGALRGPERLAPFFIIVAPLALSGLLFLGAAWAGRMRTQG